MKLLSWLILIIISLLQLHPFNVNAIEPDNSLGSKLPETEIATFAGGCFWCMEPPFENIKGVYSVISGYTGGNITNPTYEQVCSGSSGHAEAIQVTFNPALINYEALLDIFWHNIDPTTVDQQFADHGSQYRTAIFYHSETQKKLAIASKEQLAKTGKFDKPIVTKIDPAGPFYRAEDYHQDYYKKNPLRYKFYRSGSGRDRYLRSVWGDDKNKDH